MTIIAFIGMSLAWSFSWFAMKLQVDSFVAPEISLFYRFFSVAILMIILCIINKKRLKPFRTEWKFFIFIALTNFCLNSIIGYHTTKYIPSGMIAVISSLSIITSEIFKILLDNKKNEPKVILSSLIGFTGLLLFIFPNLKFNENSKIYDVILGIFLAILMMIITSFGNYLVEKNKHQNHTPLYTLIAYSSLLSSIYLLIINFALNNQFTIDLSTKYIFSLLYQIFFASIVAYLCFYYLIQKIGVVKANYSTLIYPPIALIISSFFESFEFTILGCMGMVFIMLALAIEFMPKNLLKKFKYQCQLNQN